MRSWKACFEREAFFACEVLAADFFRSRGESRILSDIGVSVRGG